MTSAKHKNQQKTHNKINQNRKLENHKFGHTGLFKEHHQLFVLKMKQINLYHFLM